jgi:hypothetical protein
MPGARFCFTAPVVRRKFHTSQRGLTGVQGPVDKKSETAQLPLDGFGVKVMYKPDHITTVKTVKISANTSLKASQRIIFADGKLLKIADIAQRQGETHLYQADITLLDEHAVLETSAPSWARVEVE